MRCCCFYLEFNQRITIEAIIASWIQCEFQSGYMLALDHTLTWCATLLIEDIFSKTMYWHLEIEKTVFYSTLPNQKDMAKNQVCFIKYFKIFVSLSCMISWKAWFVKNMELLIVLCFRFFRVLLFIYFWKFFQLCLLLW